MPPVSRTRYPAFDVARGTAIVLMVIAHTAPSDGPARIFLTSEFLTAPLFALLVGAGVEFGAQHRAGQPPWFARFLASQCIRAVLIGLFGVLLAAVYHAVAVVLVPLAMLLVMCALAARAPSWLLAVLVLVSTAASVFLTHLATQAVTTPGYGTSPSLGTQALLFVGGGPYRLFAFAAYGFAGMLIARAYRAWTPCETLKPWRVQALGTLGLALLAAMVGCLIVPNLVGIEVHAYDGSLLETLGNLAGSAGVVVMALALDAATNTSRTAAHAYGTLTQPLQSMGRASLTLYAVHILLLRAWVEATGRPDDAWIVTIGVTLALAAFSLAWQASARLSPPTGATRRLADGPLEGIVSLAAR